jgi:hypothetical protein
VDKYQRNLAKTFELIDACFNLKQAYLMKKYPKASAKQISNMVYEGILSRKERQWKSLKA